MCGLKKELQQFNVPARSPLGSHPQYLQYLLHLLVHSGALGVLII